jgi:hypothetical protein
VDSTSMTLRCPDAKINALQWQTVHDHKKNENMITNIPVTFSWSRTSRTSGRQAAAAAAVQGRATTFHGGETSVSGVNNHFSTDFLLSCDQCDDEVVPILLKAYWINVID